MTTCHHFASASLPIVPNAYNLRAQCVSVPLFGHIPPLLREFPFARSSSTLDPTTTLRFEKFLFWPVCFTSVNGRS